MGNKLPRSGAFAVARSAFFVTTFPRRRELLPDECGRIAPRARRVFSRAPRARPDPLYIYTRLSARSSLDSRAHDVLPPRAGGVQERGSQGFANRAEAHVDRRGDEVRVPRPLEVLSSIPRGLVIGGDIRGLSASSPFASARARRRPRSRVPERSPSGLPHASREVSAAANDAVTHTRVGAVTQPRGPRDA